MPQVMAKRAADFLNAQGVAAHPHYTDSSPQADAAGTLEDLRYLGVNVVRTEGPNPLNQGQSTLAYLADHGIDFSFIAGGDPTTALSRIKTFLDAHPGSVRIIEGVNEPNNWPITYAAKTGPDAAKAFQTDLYAAVNADPAMASIPVAGMSSWPGIGAPSDYMNIHAYPTWARQPRAVFEGGISDQQAIEELPKGFVITEGGWHTGRADGEWEGVDERTQAKLLLNFIMDGMDLGAAFVAPYELYDEYSDPTNSNWTSHWGMFHFDGTAKISATAIHNLNTTLFDTTSTAVTFVPKALDYTVVNPGVYNFLLQQGDGDFFLVLWNEPDLWDDANNKAIDPIDLATTINFGSAFDVEVFDPLVGTTAVRSLGHVSSAMVALDGHPLLLRLSNGTATTGLVVGGTEGQDTLKGGSGNDTLNGWGRDDSIDGGAGDDVLTGGWGVDSITTGTGHDRVVVLTGEGGDFITDFDPTTDTIEILGAAAGTTATVTDTAQGARIAWSNDSMVLLGTTSTSLKAANLVGVTLALPQAPASSAFGKLWLANSETTDLAFNPTRAKSLQLDSNDDVLLPGGGIVPSVAKASVTVDETVGGLNTVRFDGSWSALKLSRVEDADGGQYLITNFVHADAILGGTAASSVEFLDAKRGTAQTGSGNDTISITAKSNGAGPASNTFHIASGAGDDTVTVKGAAGYTWLDADGSVGKDTFQFSNVRGGVVNGGADADTIGLGVHTGKFTITLDRGEVQGDIIKGFAGAGVSGGDVLDLVGYGTGAKIAFVSGNVFKVAAADGFSETFTLEGVSKLVFGDFLFH